jgi:hypothetical protein
MSKLPTIIFSTKNPETLGSYLLLTQIADDRAEILEYFVDKRIRFSHLHRHEMPPALLSNFDEGIAGHILHSVVSL